MSRHWWLSLLVLATGCQATPDVPNGLSLTLSKDAIAALDTLLLPTVDLQRFLGGLRPCSAGAVLQSDDGGVLQASVRCLSIPNDKPTTKAIEGTLRDEAGVIAIRGETIDETLVERQTGPRRIFSTDGDVAGLNGAGAVLAWRWSSPSDALRSLPGIKDSQHPALMLLDGRTSGALFPGTVLAPVVFFGLHGPTGAAALRHGVQAMAERLGTEVVAKKVAGMDALCTNGIGLLEGFSPCAAYVEDLAGVAVGFNEEALVRALAGRAGPGPSEVVFDFGAMVDSDLSIEGVKKWPFSRIRIQPRSADAVSIRIEP